MQSSSFASRVASVANVGAHRPLQLTRLRTFTASAQVTPQARATQLHPPSSAEFSLRPCVSAAGSVSVWPLRVRSWSQSFRAVVCKKRQTPRRLRR